MLDFSDEDRCYFFDFSQDEIQRAKRLQSNFNSVHFLLLLGYVKAKSVCLVFQGERIKEDLDYICDCHFSGASIKAKCIDRQKRSRLYDRISQLESYNEV